MQGYCALCGYSAPAEAAMCAHLVEVHQVRATGESRAGPDLQRMQAAARANAQRVAQESRQVLDQFHRQHTQLMMEWAATALGQLEPGGWPAWLVCVLRLLEGQATDDEYRAVLQALQESIATRLAQGCWEHLPEQQAP